MTSKEAIEILRKGYPDISTYPVNEYQNHHDDMALYNEAVYLAIKALKVVDDVNHTVYRNENCKKAGKCYDYIGYHCAGCKGE